MPRPLSPTPALPAQPSLGWFVDVPVALGCCLQAQPFPTADPSPGMCLPIVALPSLLPCALYMLPACSIPALAERAFPPSLSLSSILVVPCSQPSYTAFSLVWQCACGPHTPCSPLVPRWPSAPCGSCVVLLLYAHCLLCDCGLPLYRLTLLFLVCASGMLLCIAAPSQP